jgi:hypothetical protein
LCESAESRRWLRSQLSLVDLCANRGSNRQMNESHPQEKNWAASTVVSGAILGGFFLAAGEGVVDIYLVFLPLAVLMGLWVGRWQVLFALAGVLLARGVLAITGYEPTGREPPPLTAFALYTIFWQGLQLGFGVAVRDLIDLWRLDRAGGRS